MNTNIINLLEKHGFSSDKIECIFFYGNRRGSDIDFFVITNELTEYRRLLVDRYDVCIVNSLYARLLIRYLDPLITEPLLTGKCIFGSSESFHQIFRSVKVTVYTIDYLISRARLVKGHSWTWANQGDFCNALLSVVWANTYTVFAYAYYQTPDVPLALTDVAQRKYASDLVVLRKIIKMDVMNDQFRTKLNYDHYLSRLRELLTTVYCLVSLGRLSSPIKNQLIYSHEWYKSAEVQTSVWNPADTC